MWLLLTDLGQRLFCNALIPSLWMLPCPVLVGLRPTISHPWLSQHVSNMGYGGSPLAYPWYIES